MKIQEVSNKIDYFSNSKSKLLKRIIELNKISPFYKRLFRRAKSKLQNGIEFSHEFFNEIPYTTKDDLKRSYPFGFLCKDKSSIKGYHESSGTTNGGIGSSRTSVLKTSNDIKRDIQRRQLKLLDLKSGDFAINHLPYSMTSSAISFHRSLTKQGIIPVAVDQGSLYCSYNRLFELLTELKAKVLVTSNPFIVSDILIYNKHINIFSLPHLKYIVTVGVPISRDLVQEIEERYDIRIFSFYGLSEFGAVGVPCSEGKVHIHEDFFVELYNPSLNIEENLSGEIIISDLYTEGSPLFRYRTGDVGQINYNKCSCGLKTPTLEVYGRIKDIIFDGSNYILPIDFQNIFLQLTNTSPVFKITVNKDNDCIDLSIQQYIKDDAEIDIIKERVKELTSLKVNVERFKVGHLFKDLYSQELFKKVQKIKSMAFHDERKKEWLITY